MKKYGIALLIKNKLDLHFFETEQERKKFLTSLQLKHKTFKYFTFEDEKFYTQFAQGIEDFKAINRNVSKLKNVRITGEKTYLGEEITTLEEFINDLCDRVNNINYQVSQNDDLSFQFAILRGFGNALMNRLNRVCGRKNQAVI